MGKRIGIACLVLVALSGSQAWAAKPNDFQLWTELKISHAFGKSPWVLNWATESRISENVTQYETFNTTIGFDYQVRKWLKPGFYYRVEKTHTKPVENRLIPQIELSHEWGPFELSTRQRFEIRIFPNDTRFRYRPRFKVALPVKTKPVSFKPFISDEFFVEPNHGNLNQNRFAVGNTFGFNKDKITFDLYYLLRRDKNTSSPGWTNHYVLGTSLAFKF